MDEEAAERKGAEKRGIQKTDGRWTSKGGGENKSERGNVRRRMIENLIKMAKKKIAKKVRI